MCAVSSRLERETQRNVELEFGGYQAIQWDREHRVYWGASEMRKDGQAIGY